MLHDPNVKVAGHVLAGTGVITSYLDYAPKIVAVLAMLWYGVQFYEYIKGKILAKRHKKRRKSDQNDRNKT